MIFIFNGAEVPSNRLLLESMCVEHMGFSFWRAWKRGLPKNKEYYLSDHFDPEVKIYVDWKNDGYDSLTFEAQRAYDEAYKNFMLNNADRIEMSVFHEDGYVGQQIVEWNGKGKPPEDCIVGVSHELIESDMSLSAKIRMAMRDGTKFMAMGTAKPDNLRSIPFDYASTLAWLSPMRHGETIIWDGARLVRYPKSMQDQARRRYKNQVQRAGLDFSKFLADDNKEVARVTIWSLLQLQNDIQRKRGNSMSPTEIVDMYGKDHSAETKQNSPEYVDNKPALTDNNLPVKVDRSEGLTTLPGLTFGTKKVTEMSPEGEKVTKDIPVAGISDTPLRQCNTCFVAATCPAMVPDQSCAFKIPVELRTKDQLKSLLTAMLEMQAQRVFFARFAEEQNGGYPDPNLSLEMDRLFRITKNLKDIESETVHMKMTAEVTGGPGVLANIFGEQAKQKQLPAPMSDNEVSKLMSDILDADIVD